MSKDYEQFEQRKQDHIDLALMSTNQADEHNPFDRITMQHEALPDFDFDEIQIESMRLGHAVATPFIISSMTAGHRDALNINQILMHAAAERGWGMGVGSQRRELTDHSAAQEWHTLRREFPKVSLFSNLGVAQLASTKLADIQRLTDAVEASGLIIHCNPLQECIQPEGTPSFKGCWDALERLVNALSIPIIVKETGCGFSLSTMTRLKQLGVAAIDVSGLGGTHWGRIEGHRAQDNSVQQRAALTFRHWGIDTFTCVKNAQSICGTMEVWGSGGVRHGLDAAKLIAAGATTVGFAKPLLQAALVSVEQTISVMTTIEYELKVAMFCTGSRVLSDLQEKLCP